MLFVFCLSEKRMEFIYAKYKDKRYSKISQDYGDPVALGKVNDSVVFYQPLHIPLCAEGHYKPPSIAYHTFTFTSLTHFPFFLFFFIHSLFILFSLDPAKNSSDRRCNKDNGITYQQCCSKTSSHFLFTFPFYIYFYFHFCNYIFR